MTVDAEKATPETTERRSEDFLGKHVPRGSENPENRVGKISAPGEHTH